MNLNINKEKLIFSRQETISTPKKKDNEKKDDFCLINDEIKLISQKLQKEEEKNLCKVNKIN